MPQWLQYEEQIFSYLRSRFPEDSIMLRGEKIKGRHSGRKRQIDILMYVSHGRSTYRVVVECKHFSTKICLPRADAFVGFLDDAKPALGVMVTSRGFSGPAKKRLDAVGIYTMAVQPNNNTVDMPCFAAACCERCNVNRIDCPLIPIEWCFPPLAFVDADGEGRAMLVGYCSSCGNIYVDCGRCTQKMKVSTFRRTKTCRGCGIKFQVIETDTGLRLKLPNGTLPGGTRR